MRAVILMSAVSLALGGCVERRYRAEYSWLYEVVLIQTGGAGLVSVGAELPPEVDKQEFAAMLMWHLRKDAAALDSQYDAGGTWRTSPTDPRGRDIWAAVLADLKGIPFCVYQDESQDERDRRLERLLQTIAAKERGEVFYIEDFVKDLDFHRKESTLRLVFEFRADVDPKTFAKLAIRHLRNDASALRSGEDEWWPSTDLPRGRDMWAAVLAQLKRVPFRLLHSESEGERDRRIEALLRAIDEKER